ncbi:MAG: LacI family DNA-binding transcriptional regulator [Roseinatronobacter sp.]
MLKPRPNIKDVAQTAGVSTATVSRALTQPDRLTDSTRERVLKAIRETGYRVNRAGRNLRTQRAGAILVQVPNLGNPFFSVILSSIHKVLTEQGYAVLVIDSQQFSDPDQAVADMMLNGTVDGLISLDGRLSTSMAETLTRANLNAHVVFCCEWSDSAALPSIRSDNALGTKLAVDHLVSLGHRKIAHVCGPEGNVLSAIRKQTFVQRCAEHGISVPPEWLISGDFSLATGVAAADRLLEMQHRPTAIFCASDEIALSFVSRLQQRGYSVPGDFSVVGFDDIDMSAFSQPALTTIRQDRASLGRLAADRLLALLNSDDDPETQALTFVPTELIIRATTAPCH